ncbi:hypothetical protein Plhal710r2_c033g0121921 [Plasmopara halstedii]
MTKSRSDRSPKIRILGVCSTIVPISCGLLRQFTGVTLPAFVLEIRFDILLSVDTGYQLKCQIRSQNSTCRMTNGRNAGMMDRRLGCMYFSLTLSGS